MSAPPSAIDHSANTDNPAAERRTQAMRLQRSIVPALLLIILLLVLGNAYMLWQERASVLAASAQSQQNLVGSMANRLDTTLQKASMLTRLLADDILEHPARIVGMPYRARLIGIANDNPDIEMVVLIRADGTPYVSSLPARPGKLNFADRSYFRFHLDHPEDVLHIDKPMLGRATGKRFIPVSRRVNDQSGRFMGVIMIALDSERLMAELKALDLGAHGVVGYAHLNGTLLVRQPDREQLAGLNLVTSSQFQNHYLKELRGSFTDISPIDHLERRYTFERLANYPVVMVSAVSDDDLMPLWLTGGLLKASYLAALAMLLAAIAYFLHRQISRVAEAEHKAQAANEHTALTNTALTDTLALNFAILNSASFGIIASDALGRIVLFNRAAGTLLGYSTSEVGHRMTPLSFFDPKQACEALGLEMPVPRLTGLSYAALVPQLQVDPQREWLLRRRDGSTLPVQITVSPLADHHGPLNGHVTIFVDLTRQKQLDSMKSDFVSVVSHELRTPLTSIKGSLALLRHSFGTTGEVGQHRLLDIGIDNCDKLVRLVSDILDLDKLDRRQMTMFRTRQRVAPLLARAIELNQPYADQYDVRYVLNVDDPTLSADLDADRFLQIIGNLMSNAAKFSHPGGVVQLRLSRQGEDLVIDVEDQGVGIPADFHHKVFERFTQSCSAMTRNKPGTGLGMSIAKSLVDAHGGQISFSSVEGRGTTFTIRLRHLPVTNDGMPGEASSG